VKPHLFLLADSKPAQSLTPHLRELPTDALHLALDLAYQQGPAAVTGAIAAELAQRQGRSHRHPRSYYRTSPPPKQTQP
jgi:hypothetical protein